MVASCSVSSVGFASPSPIAALGQDLHVQTICSLEEPWTVRPAGRGSSKIFMQHHLKPSSKKSRPSLRHRSGVQDAAFEPKVSRRSLLGSALAAFISTLSVRPENAGAEVPHMSLEEAVKPPELKKTFSEPLDSTPLQGSYFQQFFDGITWKGQTIKYSAKDVSLASHAASERTMELKNNKVEETAQFSNKDVEINKVVASGTSLKPGKTYLKPSGDMLCLSTASLTAPPKPEIHFEKVLVNPEDPKSRIVLTPVYESAESGNFQLKHIVFSRESADGATTKVETDDIWGLPIGHDMGLPVKGRWTKTVETINADYVVQVMNTDYDRVAIPVHQDTCDRRVFALANEVIVALPATIGAVSKGKTTHMDVLWTISDANIVKGMFSFDKQGNFWQDITERYARAG